MSIEDAALAGWASNPAVPPNERLRAADAALSKYVDREDRLRELLSYCRTKADGPTESNMYGDNSVYDDIANRLANILDGEK